MSYDEISQDYNIIREEIISNFSGFKHEAAWIEISDWKGRKATIYAERIVPSENELPAIIHCLGGGQMIKVQDLLFWAKQGYACASFDWQIGDINDRDPNRTSQWPVGMVVQHTQNRNLEQCVIPLAIQAAMATTSWLSDHPSVNPDQIGMSGISWGGYLTWITAAYDKRIKAICPVYGCGIFERERINHFSKDVANFWRQNWDPQALAEKQTAPAAYLSGTNDFFGNCKKADQLLKKLPANSRWSLLPNADHSIDDGASKLARAWMAQHLKQENAVPNQPILTPSLEIQADTKSTIHSNEIWWTNTTKPRKACWNQGKPDSSARIAFAKVTYENGISLCSSLRYFDKPSNLIPLADTWPTLKDGIGWRWELGSTQLYENEVTLESLDSGKRIEVISQEKSPDCPNAFYIRQINDARWKPKNEDYLEFGWEQKDTPSKITAFLINSNESFDPEYEIDCPSTGSTYQLKLPHKMKWTDIINIRLHCHGLRQAFTFGPLRKIR